MIPRSGKMTFRVKIHLTRKVKFSGEAVLMLPLNLASKYISSDSDAVATSLRPLKYPDVFLTCN